MAQTNIEGRHCPFGLSTLIESCVEKRKETSGVVVLCTLRAELHVLKQTDAEPVRSRSDELMRSSANPPFALSLGGVDGAVQ